MGQCIASMADGANSRQIVSSDMYRDYADYGLQCAALPGTEGDNHSPIYRMSNMDSGEYEDLCKRWSSSSCARLMEQMCTERKDKVMLAHRKMIRMENKIIVDERTKKEKSMNVHIFDPTRISISYAEFWRRVIAFGRGLRTLGVGKGAKVALYEETRWEWLTSMFGCWTQGIVVSTVYANLGEDALIYALCETECQAIVCNHSNVEKLVALFEKHGLDQTIIIYLDELPAGVDTKDMTVAKWNDVMTAGSSRKGMRFEARIPQDEEAVKEDALIMYTSGTTGNPKGVVHSHASLYCGVMSIAHRVEDVLGPQKEDEWYCSYLPLAHILEFALTMALLQRGMSVGYGSPRTLTDQFAHPHGDFTEYRPFLVAAVPRVYDTIKKAVEARLPKPGTLKRTIYDNAYRSRLKALHEGNDTPYYNRKVFSVPRALLGGRAQVIFSGGGPLSASTQEFLNVVFGMVSQGWGLTETVCCGGIQRLGNMESDSVGQIIRSVEVKLVDTEEFKHTDKPNPRGEIYVRGPFLFKGYYKQPTLTQEAIDADGWFHTGDVASITDSGALRIVGRVKALAKNANGEYLALETLESIYGNNELCLPNSCCVLVNPHRNYIALLALTSEELVEEFKRKYRISCPKFPEALEDPNFQREALKSFQNSARAAGRRPFEVIQQIKLLKDEWTAENGVLTAAMKLKRRRIDECYADDINQLFKQE